MGGGFLYAIIILSVQPLLKQTELITWIYYFSPYTRVLDFLIGVSAALLYKRYPLKIKSKLLMTILEALSLLLVIVCIIYESQIHYIFIVGIIFALCFYIFGQEKGYLSEYFALSIFRKLAKYSYSFYLIHYLVIMSMVKTLNVVMEASRRSHSSNISPTKSFDVKSFKSSILNATIPAPPYSM